MAQLGSLIVTGDSRFLNTINGNISGTAANVRGTVAIANGGTGKTTAAEARTALGIGNVGTLTYGSDTTKYLRNDGSWQVPPNSNTTYTFANGTNGFTVTPSGGSAQTVTVTPSITNNVTGSGTSGYIAKFNGGNTITNGPQLGSGTTTYLRNDGTWQTPTNTTYTFANGTNGFTVTPSGGSAQTVTVTPSITNNVTGSGTSGYIAKFNGANTITSGPQLGSSTSTYLRNDGTWQTPPNTVMKKTRYTITATSWSNAADANGYYTYTVTLSPTLATSYPPNVYIAGSGDSTFPTDTEKEQYALLEQCNHTATNSLILYATTKPESNFYVYIEGQGA